eukprot:Filipodium_phascolosomae@DN2320_c0_g1_i1.p1
MSYISHQGLLNLKKYRYNGKDCSYIYQQFLSPLADWFVVRCPLAVAPNLITVAGFCCVLVSHAVCLYYSPNLSTPLPSWVHLLAAIMVFVNQTLDNMDGKQARRTNSSSPLGLLIDHGCDAIHTTLGPLNIAASAQLGGTGPEVLFAWLTPTMMFWSFTWKQVWTGSLILPAVNGATEGMLATVAMHIFCIFAPASLWLTPVFQIGNYIVTVKLVACAIGCSFGILVCIDCLYQVFLAKWKELSTRPSLVYQLIVSFAPFLMLTLVAYLCSNTKILGDFTLNCRLVFYFVGIQMSMLVALLHLSHVTDDPIISWPLGLLVPNLLILLNCVPRIGGLYDSFVFEPYWVLILSNFLAFFSFVHMVFSVTFEICNLLRIKVFTIPPINKQKA